jgi:hypothetical protein
VDFTSVQVFAREGVQDREEQGEFRRMYNLIDEYKLKVTGGYQIR